MKWFKSKPDPRENYIPKRPLTWWIDDLSHEHCGLMDDPVRGWDKLPWPDNEKCYLAIDKTEYDKLEEKLKSLEQEIERLKDDLYKRTNAELNEQKMRIYQTNLSAELSTKLKEREELIKEAIPLIESKIYTITNEEWLEKARKMVGEV